MDGEKAPLTGEVLCGDGSLADHSREKNQGHLPTQFFSEPNEFSWAVRVSSLRGF